MALFIGAFIPDRQLDQSAFCKALTKVAIDLAGFKKHPLQASGPNLDLYFLMSGKEEMPDFDGMRLHSFDASTCTLKIESSVPRQMIQSVHAERYVVAALQDAVDGAHDFFEMQQIEFQREEYLNLIETLNSKNGVSLH
ncbi:MAG: hypothetical protein ACU85E_07380 [Gammaproteobacteria bacterium]